MPDSALQVLVLSTRDTSGGAARAAYRIHDGVKKYGIISRMLVKIKTGSDATVHSLDEYVPKNTIARLIDWIVTKIKNRVYRLIWSRYPKRDNQYMSDLRSTRLFHAMDKFEYDVLHLHWINQRFFSLRKLRSVNKPIVWTLHDCWPFCGICHYLLDCEKYKDECGECPRLHSSIPNDLSRRIFNEKKKFYSGLDLHIVTPSRWLGECAQNSALFHGLPIHVIPNCVDIDVFRPLEDKLIYDNCQERSEPYHILFGAVNALVDKMKGFNYLTEALSILRTKYGLSDFDLTVFGTAEPQEGVNFPFPVKFCGLVRDIDEMVRLYNDADVVAVPSIVENLSCVIMESLSCGTPVVAFDVGGNKDMVDHMENGYLAKGYEVEDFARGLIWCKDNAARCELSRHARKKVVNNFSIEHVCKEYADLYRSISK